MVAGRTLVSLFERALRLVLSRGRRAALGAYIADRANGDSDNHPQTNGEMWFLRQIKNRNGAAAVTVFDAGANLGGWTRAAAEVFGPAATIYAFEPVPATFRRLQENLGRWNLPPKVVPEMAALGEQEGQAAIFTSAQSDEYSSLYKRRTDAAGVHFEEAEAIRVVPGDAFCRDRGVEGIDLLKIDTEGHEMAVLRGFTRMLSEARIELVQFEYGSTWLDSRTQLLDAFELFAPHGYRLAKLFPAGLLPLDQYDQALETYRYANYVAFRRNWDGAFPTAR